MTGSQAERGPVRISLFIILVVIGIFDATNKRKSRLFRPKIAVPRQTKLGKIAANSGLASKLSKIVGKDNVFAELS